MQQVKVLRNEIELSKNKIIEQESELEEEKKLKSKLMFQLDSDCSKLKMDLKDYQLANDGTLFLHFYNNFCIT